jgi:hypothetical protein
LLNDKIKCTINPVVLAPCFDHKSINLIFPNENSISRPNRRKKLRIFESTLRDPDLDIVIWYTVFETYLHHFRLDPELIAERNRTLEICGTARKLLRDAGPSQSYYYNDLSMDIINARERCLARISSILESLPLELVHNFDIDISADLFMEVLLNNIRNELASYQSFIEKFKLYFSIDLRHVLTLIVRISSNLKFLR